MVWHKPDQKYIISDAFSRLASANNAGYGSNYSKLDALFMYHTTLVEINLDLVKKILDGYMANDWWAKVYKQVIDNKELGVD